MAGKVVGRGINDTQEPVFVFQSGMRVPDKRYIVWAAMLQRSYSSPSKVRQPGYATSEVCEQWLKRSIFNAWMDTQEWEGLALDKNILKEDNNTYCPEFCVFVPSYLNNLFTSRHNFRGEYPLGVTRINNARYKAYCARVSDMGHRRTLGKFYTPLQAHAAWQKGKIEAIRTALDRYINEKFFRRDVYEAVHRRITLLELHIATGVETTIFK